MSKRKHVPVTAKISGLELQRSALVGEMTSLVQRRPELEPVLQRLANVGGLHEVTRQIYALKKYRLRVSKSAGA
jgi:hypothetical protein